MSKVTNRHFPVQLIFSQLETMSWNVLSRVNDQEEMDSLSDRLWEENECWNVNRPTYYLYIPRKMYGLMRLLTLPQMIDPQSYVYFLYQSRLWSFYLSICHVSNMVWGCSSQMMACTKILGSRSPVVDGWCSMFCDSSSVSTMSSIMNSWGHWHMARKEFFITIIALALFLMLLDILARNSFEGTGIVVGATLCLEHRRVRDPKP